MRAKILQTLFLSTLMIFYTSCGGGGGGGGTAPAGGGDPADPTPTPVIETAYFIDSAVGGVSYTCGDITDVTDEHGTFQYTTECDAVTFKLGNLSLGSIDPESINQYGDKQMLIQDLVGVNRIKTDDENVIKIAALLQSLDDNNDTEDGISIPQNISSKITTSGDIDDLNLSQIETILANIEIQLKEIESVQEHLQSYIIDIQTVTDNAPAAFVFTDTKAVARNTWTQSNKITLSGLKTPTILEITNGQYSLDNGTTWLTDKSVVANGQEIIVRHTSSSDFSDIKTTTLTIGGRSGTFSSTTVARDITPDGFSFQSLGNLPKNTETLSNTITITGINDTVEVSITGGEYRINGGTWTREAGTIQNNQTIQVRHTTATDFSTQVFTTLTIGENESTFSSTTIAQDITPDLFVLGSSNLMEKNTVIHSDTITITGINDTVEVSIENGKYKIGDSDWTDQNGTIENNQTIQVQHTCSSEFDTTITTTLRVGTTSQNLTSTTRVADTTPNDFNLTSITNVPIATSQASNVVTISGIEIAIPISIENGEYSIDGGTTWRTDASTISNGGSLQVRHTSSSSYETSKTTTVTVGNSSKQFVSTTTILIDTTPDSFEFGAKTNIPKKTLTESNSVTITGINTQTIVSITEGEYRINGGAWRTTDGNISNDDNITVRHTSADSFESTITTTITIGEVTQKFESTTVAQDLIPDSFSFLDLDGVELNTTRSSNIVTITGINVAIPVTITNGNYSIDGGDWINTNGIIENNQTIQLKLTSASAYDTTVTARITIGEASDTFNATTKLAPGVTEDKNPNSFDFISQLDHNRSTLISSNIITITGINVAIPVSITDGNYSINGGVWTDQNGTIENNQTIQVRHTSRSDFGQTQTTQIKIGSIEKNFSSTTVAQDSIPDSFTFADLTVERNATIVSNSLTITGINDSVAVSITDGNYSIDGGDWTDQNGTIENNQTIRVQHQSSNSYDTPISTTLTIGVISDTFTSTTRSADITPNSFSFESRIGVEKSTEMISADANISGIEIAIPILISEGSAYRINNGVWLTQEGLVSNGDLVSLRHTSANQFDTNTTTTVTIGIEKTFISTTRSIDLTPENFSFDSQTNVQIDTNISSNTETITGLEGESPLTIINGEYKIGTSDWSDQNGTIANDQTIQVRHTSSSEFETNTTTTITIGGISREFTTRTEAIDNTPEVFTFTDNSSVTKNTLITSNTITINGINVPLAVSIVGGEYSIDENDANWTTETGTIANGQTIRVRHTSSKISRTETNTTLTIGTMSDIFTSTTDNVYFIASLVSGDPVSGIQYSCGDENGTTTSEGSFTYICSGTTLEFRLNTLILGSIDTDDVNIDKNITLQEIAGIGRDTITSAKLAKIAWLLHSLDDDGDSTNGYTIATEYLNENGTKIELNGAIENFTDEQIASELKRIGKYPAIKFDAIHSMLTNLKSSGATIKDFATSPEQNSTQVGPYAIIKIGFGEPMDSTTLTSVANIALRKNLTGSNETGSCSYDPTTMSVVCHIIKDTMLGENSPYSVIMSKNIKNSGGITIAATTFGFQTGVKNIIPKLKTGQTVSYDATGTIDETATIKDDGYYDNTIGTTRSFTRADDILTDGATGLAWIDDSTATSITRNWTALQTYCSGLTTGSKTWRLPTMKELSLIADKSRGGESTPAIFSSFTNIAHEENTQAYWTSDLDPEDVNLSYAFLHYDGVDMGAAAEHNESVALNVRCVSGDEAPSVAFIRDEARGMVVDTSSGLMWEDNTTQPLKWLSDSEEDSIEYCENLVLGGYDDWRVPNHNELLSILDMKNYDPTTTDNKQPVFISPVFQYKAAASYWTSTSYAPDKTKAWTVNFGTTGSISDINDKIYATNLRCVRGK